MRDALQSQRRAILTGGLAATAALLTGCSSKSDSEGAPKPAAAGAAKTPSPAAAARPDAPWSAFSRLMDGNKRWVDGALQHPDRDPERRDLVA
ncbi:carbonic anhydrase, partial [Streptomyces sp. NPDC050704]